MLTTLIYVTLLAMLILIINLRLKTIIFVTHQLKYSFLSEENISLDVPYNCVAK